MEVDSEVLDSFKDAIEEMQPMIDDIEKRIKKIKKSLEGREETLMNKMVSPRTDEFKDFWKYRQLPPMVPFQTVYLNLLSIAESLDLETRTVRLNKLDADRFAKGIRNHTIFSLIPIIIDGVTVLC